MTARIRYPALEGPGRLLLFQPEEKNDMPFEKFVAICKKSLAHHDFETANKTSQRAALLHGAPGLILYFKTMFETLKQEKNNGEIIEMAGSNLLTFLILAKKLAGYEKNAETIIKEFFPEYCNNNEIDWGMLEALLIELADLEHWTADPIEAADVIYNQCVGVKS